MDQMSLLTLLIAVMGFYITAIAIVAITFGQWKVVKAAMDTLSKGLTEPPKALAAQNRMMSTDAAENPEASSEHTESR